MAVRVSWHRSTFSGLRNLARRTLFGATGLRVPATAVSFLAAACDSDTACLVTGLDELDLESTVNVDGASIRLALGRSSELAVGRYL